MRLHSGVLAGVVLATLSLPLPAAAPEPLSFRTAVSSALVFVHELPDPEGREQALQYIQSRAAARLNVEIIDALSTPEPQLREKLKNGFLLYATISPKSKLLTRMSGGLGWQVDSDTFRWREAQAQLRRARVLFTAQNPYAGGGYAGVFAAGSNGAFGPVSASRPFTFAVMEDSRFVHSGQYGPDFVIRDRLPLALALEDANELFATIERVHPDPYTRLTREQYGRAKQDAIDAITAEGRGNSQVSIDRLSWLLSRAVAAVGDGHTFVNTVDTMAPYSPTRRQFPPFVLGFDNGRLLIRSAADDTLIGAELTAVNGTPTQQFLQPVLGHISAESSTFRTAQFGGGQAFWYHLSDLFDCSPTWKFSVLPPSGKPRHFHAEAVTHAEFHALLERLPKRTTARPEQPTLQFLANESVALLTYPTFDASPADKNKLDDLFRQIAAKRPADLILDIRDNGGGNSRAGDWILGFLYSGKFSQVSRMDVKASPDIDKYLPAFSRPIRAAMNGTIYTKQQDEALKPTVVPPYTGRKWLLIDNGVFSSGVMLAAAFRDYQVGTTIGYETGGVPLAFGDLHRFRLTHSGIQCGVSWKRFYPPKPRSGDDRHGVMPDIPLTAEKLALFRNEPDPALAFTLAEIAKQSR